MRSAGLVTALGAALYAFPLLVWVRYSEEIVSAGGLAAFVEAAVGRRMALVQAAIWAFSYFLYLPYTVTDIVYEMLADVFPGIEPWRWLIELLLPVAIVGLVLLGTRPVLRRARRLGGDPARADARARRRRARPGRGADTLLHARRRARTGSLHGGASIALLFLCGSLPIFLGAEVDRRLHGRCAARWSRRGSSWPRYLLFAVFPLAAVDPALTQPTCPATRSPPRIRAAGSPSRSASGPRERGGRDRRRVPGAVTAPLLRDRDPRAQAARSGSASRSSPSTR